MKFLILFLSSGLAALILGPFLPFWAMMSVIAVLAFLTGGKGSHSFFSAALGMGLAWFFVPLWITWNTGSALPEKVARIMGIDHYGILVAATALVGFLIGGFAALTGNRFRKLFEKDRGFY